ncbi:MAG: CRISPR-associated helicase Cas3' [Clostridia bacterium]|nr:CRISPR-associated helicase Cas3' [Clostridia bacterium]
MSTDFIAHTKLNGEEQSVEEHLKNVAELSSCFSVPELKNICYLAGLLHDAGKYLPDFQKRIRGKDSIKVEHSGAGAIIVNERFNKSALSYILELCIMGHHCGIPDFGSRIDTADDSSLFGRLKRNNGDFSAFDSEITVPFASVDKNIFDRFLMESCKTKEDLIEKFAFITRYVFSCLTDADSIDTARFCSGMKKESLSADFEKCLHKLNEKLDGFNCVTELQKTRSRLQQQVYDKTSSDGNLFLMNMPTGSGKTLCSTKFALNRAVLKQKKRIIYVIPYNSIIDQTYSVLHNVFGDDAEILRHQSTFSYNDKEEFDEEYKIRATSACENWDAQIIITTAVQFFESVYDNKRRRLRKLHNFADSVIVFDEIHLMPRENMQPCLRAIEYISSLLNSDIVFLTATMPDFKKLFKEYTSLKLPVCDLIEDKSQFSMFATSRYSFDGFYSNESLLEKAMEFPSSLIVVNEKKRASELYKLAPGIKYHLSTYMTASDRTKTISKIKADLSSLEKDYPDLLNVPPERRIIVISTSLIEAGVDLDFSSAFRELTGLDSILQTGGRCNREGKLKESVVHVFEFADKKNRVEKDIRISVTRGIIQDFTDISSADSITEYYNRLFYIDRERIAHNSISRMCDNIDKIPFASYDFKMIDSKQFSVFVPSDEVSREIYQRMKYTGTVSTRAIQNYCCSVSEKEFKALLECGAVLNYDTDVYVLENLDYYSRDVGITTEGKDIIL